MKKIFFLLLIISSIFVTGCTNKINPNDHNNLTNEKGTLLLTIIKENSLENTASNTFSTGLPQTVPAESTHVQFKIVSNEITVTNRVAIPGNSTTVSIPIPEGLYTIYCLAYKENCPALGGDENELLTMGHATGVNVSAGVDNAVTISLIRPKFTFSLYKNDGINEVTTGDSVIEGEELWLYLNTANDAHQTAMYKNIFEYYTVYVLLNGTGQSYKTYGYDPSNFDNYHIITVPLVDDDTSTLFIKLMLHASIQGSTFTQIIPTQTMTENSSIPSDIHITQ